MFRRGRHEKTYPQMPVLQRHRRQCRGVGIGIATAVWEMIMTKILWLTAVVTVASCAFAIGCWITKPSTVVFVNGFTDRAISVQFRYGIQGSAVNVSIVEIPASSAATIRLQDVTYIESVEGRVGDTKVAGPARKLYHSHETRYRLDESGWTVVPERW